MSFYHPDGFNEWDNQLPGEMHVLVCYDGVIPDLEISKAQHIIHFSLPNSWTMFTRRFACSFGYYRDPFRDDDSKSQKPASSVILLDENNNEQLPKLIEFLKIHNHEVAEPIIKLANVRICLTSTAFVLIIILFRIEYSHPARGTEARGRQLRGLLSTGA